MFLRSIEVVMYISSLLLLRTQQCSATCLCICLLMDLCAFSSLGLLCTKFLWEFLLKKTNFPTWMLSEYNDNIMSKEFKNIYSSNLKWHNIWEGSETKDLGNERVYYVFSSITCWLCTIAQVHGSFQTLVLLLLMCSVSLGNPTTGLLLGKLRTFFLQDGLWNPL